VTSLVVQGLDRIATAAMRDQAAQVLYMDAAGHSTLEIAREIGVKRPVVKIIRTVAGDCVIEALRESGYADSEIVRTLGVPTARLAPPAIAA
jgi:transcriptional regulator